MLRFLLLIFCTLLFAKAGYCEEPEKVNPCQLKDDPAIYNHKLIEVTGFVSHGFEDFGLFDPVCSSWPYVWLEYGGTSKSGTMYCCGVTADRSRPKELVVENVSVPLTDDQQFKQFDNLIHNPPDTVVHGTLIGRFFSGKRNTYARGSSWGGYGHMGCCSLLVIQQVLYVDPHTREDVDYGASAEQPNLDKAGCWSRDLVPLRPYSDLIETQRSADLGQQDWIFDNPAQVALHGLAGVLRIDQNLIAGLNLARTGHGRIIYEWHPVKRKVSYMIVVSRPYWLSFYAKDASRTAWTIIAAYEYSCAKGSPEIN